MSPALAAVTSAMPAWSAMVPATSALKVEVGTLLHCSNANAVISLARSMVRNGVVPSKS